MNYIYNVWEYGYNAETDLMKAKAFLDKEPNLSLAYSQKSLCNILKHYIKIKDHCQDLTIYTEENILQLIDLADIDAIQVYSEKIALLSNIEYPEYMQADKAKLGEHAAKILFDLINERIQAKLGDTPVKM